MVQLFMEMESMLANYERYNKIGMKQSETSERKIN